ncbi:YcaO-like family protein [Massilia sp. W12]|uniref:YcaO-like family protein n=1 Tax=Massilia sp. W12 TaxID=3126507 RepID=UPI0030CC9446
MLLEQEAAYPFIRLAQPFAGVTGIPELTRTVELGQPELEVAISRVGDVSALFPGLRSGDGRTYANSGGMNGACADENPELAIVKSIAEAAERYAMTVIGNDEVVVATANELGAEALDWRLFPRCLDHEYANFPAIVPFDPDKRMRWVKGISLVSGRRLHVPVAMTHISAVSRRAESFSLPISTGVAVHTCIYEATARAIMEVVERDSIALTWYLRQPLPRIQISSERVELYRERFKAFESSQITQYLFDATTDLGIPVVYGLMVAPGHPSAAIVVTAASDLNPVSACAKAMREAVSTRLAVIASSEVPASPEACIKLEHGAVYMGAQSRMKEFDFLLKSKQSMDIENIANRDVGDSRRNLLWLINRLKEKNIEAVAVELTTEDLRESGLRAVRVVIPQLMPMSYVTMARFLAHPRLSQYGELVTGAPFTADMVNPLPQPFA